MGKLGSAAILVAALVTLALAACGEDEEAGAGGKKGGSNAWTVRYRTGS